MFGDRKSIFGYFLMQVFTILFLLLVLLISYFLLLDFGVKKGVLTAANEPALFMDEYRNQVVDGFKISTLTFPDSIDYFVVENTNKEIIKSNIPVSKANTYLDNSERLEKNFLSLSDGEDTLYIYYVLRVQLASPRLRKLIPNFEMASLLFVFALFFSVVLLIIRKVQNVLRQENDKLVLIANQIEKEDLNIQIPKRKLKEYIPVYNALEHLSGELEKSVYENIAIQKDKEEQISFLVHDLKIPLTIIKGNMELLYREFENKLNQENFDDIFDGIQEIENYIQLIIDFNLNKSRLDQNKLSIIPVDTVDQIILNKGFLPEERIKIIKNNLLEGNIKINETELVRAVNNILINALERTPIEKQVILSITTEQENLKIAVEDCGNGFSEEALKDAKKLFFTENKARTQNNHYGLGLAYSNRIITRFEGRLDLLNNGRSHGEVRIYLPLYRNGKDQRNHY